MNKLLIYFLIGIIDKRKPLVIIEDRTEEAYHKYRVYGSRAKLFSKIVKGIYEDRNGNYCFMFGEDEYQQLKHLFGTIVG